MTCIRAVLAVSVVALLGPLAAPARGAPIEALSATDAQLYASAFQAAERGDFEAADQTLARVNDPCLVGQVQFVKLTHPQARPSTFEDLVNWLRSFKDLPGANKIYALAQRLRPQGADLPSPDVALADAGGAGRALPQSRPAREAYFDGDLGRALNLAQSSGDLWIAGLASYRLAAFDQALGYFEAVARSRADSDAIRAAGAYWAARAAQDGGRADRGTPMLRLAASLPDTFYGMIAARRLELSDDPLGKVLDAALAAAPAEPKPVKVDAAGLQAPAVIRLIHENPRARRAVALAQIGRTLDAGAELRAGLAHASGDAERTAWTTLVFALNPNRMPGAPVAEVKAPTGAGVVYPTPALNPEGGFTTNKALVYAIAWQESRFDPFAVSPVGAVGMMQLMPLTAAQTAGDDSFRTDQVPLLDGPTNMKLGQQYLNWLMANATGYDILQTVAAYNGGPQMVARTQGVVGPTADSLLVVESMPYYETRAYVQKVMAAYWSYRRQFGAATPTLDAAASGARTVDARLDR